MGAQAKPKPASKKTGSNDSRPNGKAWKKGKDPAIRAAEAKAKSEAR